MRRGRFPLCRRFFAESHFLWGSASKCCGPVLVIHRLDDCASMHSRTASLRTQYRVLQCFYSRISDAERNCVLQHDSDSNSMLSFAIGIFGRHTRALPSGSANGMGRTISEYAQILSRDFAACCSADQSHAMSVWTENKLVPQSPAPIAVTV